MTTAPGSITDRQRSYLLTLLDDRDLFASPKWFDSVNAMDEGEYERHLYGIKNTLVPSLSKAAASKWIGELVKLPKAPKKTIAPKGNGSGPWSVQDVNTFANMGQKSAPGDETYAMHRTKGGNDMIVPRGSYAIERTSMRFPGAFQNDLLFFSVWISDNGERWTVRMYVSDERVKISRSLQYDVLDAIGHAPEAAAARYGHEIGKCGICSRTLTNDISRERGIGPVCAEKWGW